MSKNIILFLLLTFLVFKIDKVSAESSLKSKEIKVQGIVSHEDQRTITVSNVKFRKRANSKLNSDSTAGDSLRGQCIRAVGKTQLKNKRTTLLRYKRLDESKCEYDSLNNVILAYVDIYFLEFEEQAYSINSDTKLLDAYGHNINDESLSIGDCASIVFYKSGEENILKLVRQLPLSECNYSHDYGILSARSSYEIVINQSSFTYDRNALEILGLAQGQESRLQDLKDGDCVSFFYYNTSDLPMIKQIRLEEEGSCDYGYISPVIIADINGSFLKANLSNYYFSNDIEVKSYDVRPLSIEEIEAGDCAELVIFEYSEEETGVKRITRLADEACDYNYFQPAIAKSRGYGLETIDGLFTLIYSTRFFEQNGTPLEEYDIRAGDCLAIQAFSQYFYDYSDSEKLARKVTRYKDSYCEYVSGRGTVNKIKDGAITIADKIGVALTTDTIYLDEFGNTISLKNIGLGDCVDFKMYEYSKYNLAVREIKKQPGYLCPK